MKECFPVFLQDHFLLVHSVNFHVKENSASSTVWEREVMSPKLLLISTTYKTRVALENPCKKG
jgi:hypothetical protein